MNRVVEEMKAILEDRENYLEHYGIKRRSGRYPWGSGEDPYQHGQDFLGRVDELRKQGFTYTDENGKKLYSFGAYATIEYIDENGDNNIESWFEKLQPLLAEGSIFALIEIGNEKLRDVNAYVTIVTNNDIEIVSIQQLIEEKWGTNIFG